MPVDETPLVTGPLRPGASDADAMTQWLGAPATGDEYGGTFVLAKIRLAGLWGVYVRENLDPPVRAALIPDESLSSRAAAIARNVPAVEVEQPALPTLTGDLLEDARLVTGLTLDQIGRATGVSGRAVASWRASTVPRHREDFLRALRAIGLSLIGGLGQDGVRRWFLAGMPPRLDRLAAGDVERVAAEARAYETSPAT